MVVVVVVVVVVVAVVVAVILVEVAHCHGAVRPALLEDCKPFQFDFSVWASQPLLFCEGHRDYETNGMAQRTAPCSQRCFQ